MLPYCSAHDEWLIMKLLQACQVQYCQQCVKFWWSSPQNLRFSSRLSAMRFHPHVDDWEFVNGFDFANLMHHWCQIIWECGRHRRFPYYYYYLTSICISNATFRFYNRWRHHRCVAILPKILFRLRKQSVLFFHQGGSSVDNLAEVRAFAQALVGLLRWRLHKKIQNSHTQ